jgi:hypothetical protein
MSRKPKIIPPIGGRFNEILSSIAMGGGMKKPIKKAVPKTVKQKSPK